VQQRLQEWYVHLLSNLIANCLHLQGMDIPDIELVVQYMVPTALSILTQRFGRVGRSGQPALAILLVEPSVFQTKKKPTVVANTDTSIVKIEIMDEPDLHENLDGDELDVEDTGTEYRKKVEEAMRQWIEAIWCRREVSNKYFNNPPQTAGE